jgi:hypothetical protein
MLPQLPSKLYDGVDGIADGGTYPGASSQSRLPAIGMCKGRMQNEDPDIHNRDNERTLRNHIHGCLQQKKPII